ncbi:hypothetical protein QBC39DRAFT_374540 [Podospora conica]|nr:hypothetical protein QBC39DRAFT_374540 [Schizothecium conicum]
MKPPNLFPANLVPYALALRAFHLWKTPAFQPGPGHDSVPVGRSAKIAFLSDRLDTGNHPKEWDVVKEIFFLIVLDEVFAPMVATRQALFQNTGQRGSHTDLAKSHVKRAMAKEMLGKKADDVMINRRELSLGKQARAGENIRIALNNLDGGCKHGLILIIPWEKMVKSSGGEASRLPDIDSACLDWMLGCLEHQPATNFIRALGALMERFVQKGKVLDRLARRPITDEDPGAIKYWYIC